MGLLLCGCAGLQALYTFENLSIFGMQLAFDTALPAASGTRAFSELQHLNITVTLLVVSLLMTFVKGSVTKFELRLSASERAAELSTVTVGSPLVALADMTCLQELSIDFCDRDACLTAADVLALCTLLLGLRKLTVEGDFLKVPDLTDANVVAVTACLPELVELRVLLATALRLTPDLLPKVGEVCRGLEKLELPLHCEASVLEHWCSSATVPVLFPCLVYVCVNVVEDLVVIS
jgi:hypothetical protein